MADPGWPINGSCASLAIHSSGATSLSISPPRASRYGFNEAGNRASVVPSHVCGAKDAAQSGSILGVAVRWDILIHAEEIAWIVLGLQLHQLFVIALIRSADTVFTLALHHEVHVRSACAVWMQRFPVVSGPGGNRSLVGRVRIHTDNYLTPDCLAIAPRGLIDSSLACSTVDRVQMHRREQRGHHRTVLDVESDSLIAQLIHEVRLPIPLQARRIESVEHALEHGKWHRHEELKCWGPEVAKRPENLIRLFHWSVVAPDDRAHFPKMQMLREWRAGRNGDEGKEPVDLIRRLGNELPVPFHDVCGLIHLPQHWAGTHRMNRMRLKQKRGDHAEVPATPANSPEQVAILVSAGNNEFPIGQDDVSREEIVNRQTILSRQVPNATAQSQAANASRRDDSGRNSEPECMGGVVNVAPTAAAAHSHSSCCRIDMNKLNPGQIDDQAIVADPQATGIVASTSNRYLERMLLPEMNGGHHIGHVCAKSDQARLLADHGVVHFARLVVFRVGGFNQLATELIPELSYGFLHGVLLIRGRFTDSIATLHCEAF